MKIAIIGGGASGLCCAIAAARKALGKDVQITIYEAKDRVGKKILATGNGRCNMFNAYAGAEDYSSPDFKKCFNTVLPKDPVPPVINNVLPSNILIIFTSLLLYNFSNNSKYFT